MYESPFCPLLPINLKKNQMWEPEKTEKYPPPNPPPKFKKKKCKAHSVCALGLPIGCMKFLFPKKFITIFGQPT